MWPSCVTQRGSRPLLMCGRTALLVRQGIRPFGTTPSLGTKTEKDTPPLSTKTKLPPTEVTDFSDMRLKNYCYVDKTAHIAGLLPPKGTRSSAYLCRPEGFGKSLFLSTLQHYFEGEKDLFKGLQGEAAKVKRPVLLFDMANMGSTEKDLNKTLSKYIRALEKKYSVTEIDDEVGSRLENVLEAATMNAPEQTDAKKGVVLLIDNFEKPLVKSVGTPEELGVQKFYGDFFLKLKNQQTLENLFFLLAVGTLSGSHIKSELFTEFPWNDLSSDQEWAEVCGFSMPEIRQTFAGHIKAVGITLGTKEVPLGTENILQEFERHYVGFDFHEPVLEPPSLLYRPNDVLRMLGVKTSSPEFWIQTTPPVAESLPKSATDQFEYLRTHNLVYVDKTPFIPKLLSLSKNTRVEKTGPQYLLCRPRRFGKSLFCWTLRSFFEGRKDLFKGLKISEDKKTQWTARPVLHFDMTFGKFSTGKTVEDKISLMLSRYEELYGYKPEKQNVDVRLDNLVLFTFKKTGLTPVILMDEFDSAYHSLHDKDREEVGKVFSDFVLVLKVQSRYIHFALVIGITNFTEFKGLSVFNHLSNISLDPMFAGVCGFTREELESNYKVQIEAMAAKNTLTYEQTVTMFTMMYNGYRFSRGNVKVLNPVNVVVSLKEGVFGMHWSDTLQSSLLENVLEKYIWNSDVDPSILLPTAVAECQTPNLCNGQEQSLEVWLYLLGYLTISEEHENDNVENDNVDIDNGENGNVENGNVENDNVDIDNGENGNVENGNGENDNVENEKLKEKVLSKEKLKLCYPNEEVKDCIRKCFEKKITTSMTTDHKRETLQYLEKKDMAGLMRLFETRLNSFPSKDSPKPFQYESTYQISLYLMCLESVNNKGTVRLENRTTKGRSDVEVHINDFRYIFELKMGDGSTNKDGLSPVEVAAVQIINRNYWKSYTVKTMEPILVGVEFSKKNYNISNWVHFEPVSLPDNAIKVPEWKLVDFCRLKNVDEKAAENRWNDILKNAEKYDTKAAEENDTEAKTKKVSEKK